MIKKIIRVLNWIVFISSLLTVLILSFQGMTQQLYPQILTLSIRLMDYSFIITVIMHLIYFRKNKVFIILTVFNLLLIIVAYSNLFIFGQFSNWAYLFWDYYLLIYFGALVVKQNWRRQENEL